MLWQYHYIHIHKQAMLLFQRWPGDSCFLNLSVKSFVYIKSENGDTQMTKMTLDVVQNRWCSGTFSGYRITITI